MAGWHQDKLPDTEVPVLSAMPEDAQAYIDGSYYKIGLHGKVFIYMSGQWVLSTRPISQVKHQINVQASRFGNTNTHCEEALAR